TRDSACPIPLPSDLETFGSMDAAPKSNHYRLDNPVAGTQLTVTLDGLTTDLDLYLYTADRVLVGHSDQYGTTTEQLSTILPAAGTYELLLYLRDNPLPTDRYHLPISA